MGSAEAPPQEGFHGAVIVGTAGDGVRRGNVTPNPFALLRGLLAVGGSGRHGGGPPARPWMPARVAQAPGVLVVRGSVFSPRDWDALDQLPVSLLSCPTSFGS